MKLPRDLSGRKLVAGLCRRWDYKFVIQQGSHIIIETEKPGHHRLSVPDHDSLRIGTLNSILRAVAEHKGVMREDLLATL